MTMNDMDLHKKYFLLSFRFDKTSADDFGLVSLEGEADLFLDIIDHSRWVRRESYDFGWGHENGFERLPELDFEQLWYLLNYSTDHDNRYGSAHVIEERYPDRLLEVLACIFENGHARIDDRLKGVLKILSLHQEFNRSKVVGKSFEEIEEDFNRWKEISRKARAAIEEG